MPVARLNLHNLFYFQWTILELPQSLLLLDNLEKRYYYLILKRISFHLGISYYVVIL